MKKGRLIVFLNLMLALGGCLERTTYSTPDSSDRVTRYLLDRPPKNIDHPLDAKFGDKVILLGYDLDKTQVRRGEMFKITWYWQCIGAPGRGWRVFTHLFDANGKSKMNRDKIGPIRIHYQPEHWRAGLVIRDVQEILVPLVWASKILELRVGLWRGSRRMRPTGKSVVDDNSVEGPRIVVLPAELRNAEDDNSEKRPRPRNVSVPYTEKAPVIDGDFDDEAVWQGAVRLGGFKNVIGGLLATQAEQATDVYLMWDDDHLYVAMRAEDYYLMSRYQEHDDELWREDAFEIFLDPKGDGKWYYELQVSPGGVVFDSFLPSYRKNQNDWTSQMVVQVQRMGELNEENGDDEGWTAELAIPFSAMNEEDGVPPKPGDRWGANFFRVDKTETKNRYSAWSPPSRGDFHELDRFGQITFVKPLAATADPTAGKENPITKTAGESTAGNGKSTK